MSQRKQAAKGQRKQARVGNYIFALSDLQHPSLRPGATSRHELQFNLLTPLELQVQFQVSCPTRGALSYPGPGGTWEKTHVFGGFQPELRKASFSNDVKADPDFASTGDSKNQRLSLRTKARVGGAGWESDVSLDHPVTISD